MARIKLEFPNPEGHTLVGLLETPPDRVPTARYALFAHCFTCSKDIAAATRISRALAARGIAVLRFDFTGLGNSDGDFANTNFSSNVADLLAAARKLEADYEAPALLIGHSLGGAAVLAAVHALPSVEAVVTIASPATASHVQHLLSGARGQLEETGEAEVQIGQRRFRIRKQLLDDLDQYASADHIRHLNRALLVFHSPLDTIVSIGEAGKIFQAARHPKSFISLDKADHMLGNREDAEYVAETLVAWASRYLGLGKHGFEQSIGTAPRVAEKEVLVTELDTRFQRGLYTHRHQWLADEPKSVGGSDLGPTPYALLLMSLGACISMTVRTYARHQGLALDDVEVRLSQERVHGTDCRSCEHEGEDEGKLERVEVHLNILGALTPEERTRLLEIAARSPVYRTLAASTNVQMRFEEEPPGT